MSLDRLKLSADIKDFIAKYAAVSPNFDKEFDDPEDRFTGPDPSILLAAAEILERGEKPSFHVHSEWGSGCYKPYLDQAGRDVHDEIISKLNKI